ncbi:MAG TPA: hypothetical protein VEY31_06040 [Roseococcus sp.]|jgi:alginate O-acetyltransferase complex protein AlgJ|nr:hypothetical protein [Roseococcus sp.]
MRVSIGTAAAPGRRAVLAGLGGTLATSMAAAQGSAGQPEVSNGVVIGRNGWLFQLAAEPAGTYIKTVDQGVCDVVSEAAGILRAAGIEPALVLVPSKNRVYRVHTGSARNPPEFQNRYGYVLGEFRRNGVMAPDIDAIFSRSIAERPNEHLYFRTDSHWTPRGAELAAAVLAQALRTSNRLGPSRANGTRLMPPVTQVQTAGDLQRLLPPERRGAFPPEEYAIRLPDERSRGLLDDDAAEIALVGPSFLEPRYAYHNIVSNQMSRPVQLSWRPNNLGPFTILLEYLRSPEFRAQRPKILAWHFLELNMASGPNSATWGRSIMAATQFRDELRRLLGS